jgi:hypothetical protein
MSNLRKSFSNVFSGRGAASPPAAESEKPIFDPYTGEPKNEAARIIRSKKKPDPDITRYPLEEAAKQLLLTGYNPKARMALIDSKELEFGDKLAEGGAAVVSINGRFCSLLYSLGLGSFRCMRAATSSTILPSKSFASRKAARATKTK